MRILKCQFFDILKPILTFSGLRYDKTLKLSKLYLLDKESWLMKPFSIFDDFVKNPFLIRKLHINHVNYRHYFRKGVPGKNFKFIPYLEVEILCGGGVSLYVYYSRAKLHARKVNPFLLSQVSKILLHPFIFIETKDVRPVDKRSSAR